MLAGMGVTKKSNCPPDGACGMKMACKPRLAGGLAFGFSTQRLYRRLGWLHPHDAALGGELGYG